MMTKPVYGAFITTRTFQSGFKGSGDDRELIWNEEGVFQ
jgi:hypothetical protein